jgi:excisionase family DNA binding protein
MTVSTTREAISVTEFCSHYDVCRDTFYNEIKRGRLRARKLGKRTLVLKADAQAWADALPPLELKPHVAA